MPLWPWQGEDVVVTTARRKLRVKRVLGWLGVAAGALLVAAVAVYRSAPALLTVDSGEYKAGAMVVLGGDTYGRPARAAELFKSGAAPVVIASGAGDSAEMVRALKQNGVPESAIWREERSGSTWENAKFSAALLRRAGVTNAIVVTSWYHSRRALATFRKVAPEMRFYSRPSYWGVERGMWSQHGIGSHVRAEYVKVIGYWVRYGVRPF